MTNQFTKLSDNALLATMKELNSQISEAFANMDHAEMAGRKGDVEFYHLAASEHLATQGDLYDEMDARDMTEARMGTEAFFAKVDACLSDVEALDMLRGL